MRIHSCKCNFLKKKYPKVKPTFIDQMEQADPAKGKSLEWMVRQLNNSLIRWPEDRPRLVTALSSFYKIKRSPTLLKQYSASPDLNHYTIHQLEELSDKIEGVTQRPESVNFSNPGLQKSTMTVFTQSLRSLTLKLPPKWLKAPNGALLIYKQPRCI